MSRRHEIRLRYFEQQEGQRHIDADDHYLYATPEATIRLAIIGCGTIGQEHAQVATLLGRARVHGLYDEQRKSIEVARDRLAAQSNHDVCVYPSMDEACADERVDMAHHFTATLRYFLFHLTRTLRARRTSGALPGMLWLGRP